MLSFNFAEEEKHAALEVLQKDQTRLDLLIKVFKSDAIALSPDNAAFVADILDQRYSFISERMREQHPEMRRERPTTDQRFMALTELAKTWGTCPRLPVGAVIARGPEIIKLGFNGSPPGQPHCTDVGCLMVGGHCIRAKHAEDNVIRLAGRVACLKATLYVSHFPCWACAQDIVSAGIARVVYRDEYKMDKRALRLLKSTGIVHRFIDGEAREVNIIERQFEVDRFRGLVEREDTGSKVVVRGEQ